MTDALVSALLMSQRRRRDPYEAQTKFGDTIMQQALTPSQSWGEGLAKMLQAGVGGYFAGAGERRGEERDRRTISAMGDLLSAKTPDEFRTKVGALNGSDVDVTMLGPIMGQMLAKNQDAMRAGEQAKNFAPAYGQTAASPSPGGISSTPLPAPVPQQAGEQAQKHIQYLVNVHDFTPQQAARAVGHLFQESGFNPGAAGDGGTALGMGQWRLDRQDALRGQAQASGESVNNPTTQLDFFANEFKTRPEWQQFQGGDPKQQQAALMAYFRPAGYTPQTPEAGHGYAQRVQYGQQFAQGGQPQIMQGDNPGPMPAASPVNAPPDVPRPQASPQQIQKYQQLIASQQMTPAQAAKALDDEINQEWQVQRETRRMTWQSEQEDRRMKERADIDLRQKAPMELIAKRMDDYEKNSRPKATAAVNDVIAINQVRQLLDAGAFTGTGAEAKTWMAKLGEQVGIPSDQATNSQVLMSALANRVIAGVGGSLGTGFSNADRDFFEKAKGGQISMTESALRRLMDIGERQARTSIQQHAEEVRRLKGVPGVGSLGNDFFALPDAPAYDAWNKANPLVAPQPAQQPAPQAAPQQAQPQGGEFVSQMQPNGYATHPNPNAPTNMSPQELQATQPGAGGVTEGATATNPQTKQRVIFRGGQWVPIQ